MKPLLVAAVLTFTFARVADACSCRLPPPPKQALGKAAAVFLGKVAKIEREQRNFLVTFEVARTWKGAKSETFQVRTNLNGAACGYGFQKGKSYLVYTYQTGKRDPNANVPRQHWTNICTRTRPKKNAAADVKALGKGTVPKKAKAAKRADS